MAKRLSKTVVDTLEPSDKLTLVWDSGIAGFGLAVYPTGIKSFVFQYRTAEGKTRRYTIGKYSDSLTTDQARKRASELHREVINGGDPMGHKQQRRNAITVNQLLDQYLASPTFAEKAESTRYVDRGRINRHLRPLLGSRFADKLSSDEIRKAQKAIAEGKTAGAIKTKARGISKPRGGQGTADKAVLALRAAYAWAISQKILTENPAAAIKVAQPGQRETILEGANEYRLIFDTLDRMEAEHRIRPAAADAIRFIALTGARKGEASNLKWAYVNLQTAMVTIPPRAHKTGSRTGKPRLIALPAAAQAIIARQPEGGPDDYVFSPAKGEGAISLSKPWAKLHKEAGLPAGFGLHGLRHTLASHLAMEGASNVELMQTLGHKQISTTLRYTHFAERVRSTLAERAAATALAGLAESQGKNKAAVVPMKNRKHK